VIIVLLAGLFTLQSALAAPVVLHNAATTEAVNRSMSDHTSLRLGEYTLMRFGSLAAERPLSWQGRGSIQVCAGPTLDSTGIVAQIDSAEDDVLFMEEEKAAAALAAAQAGLICWGSIVGADVGGRIGFLRGVLAFESGDKLAAYDHFSFAARFQPNLTWDERFSKDGASVFDAAKNVTKTTPVVPVALVPALPEGQAVYVNGAVADGASGTIDLAQGTNVVQVQSADRTVGVTVEVEAGSKPTLFVPSALSDDTLNLVDTADGRESLSPILDAAFEVGTPIYVARDDQLWLTGSGVGVWKPLVAGATVDGGLTAARSTRPMAWIATGMSAVLAGGTVTAALMGRKSHQRARNQQSLMDADIEAFDLASADRHNVNASQAYLGAGVGYSLAGVGAALTAASVVVTVPLFKSGRK
jgi:hypothetical protein